MSNEELNERELMKHIQRQGALNAFNVNYAVTSATAQAVRTHEPPASLILCSASFEKNLALTITGILGRLPFPKTLK